MALAPLLPAAAVAAGSLKVDAALPYVCALPSGQQPATVRITAAFPERAAVGEEIRPTDVTTTVELPAAAVAGLTAPEAATVRAETRLTVGVAQGEQRAEAAWSGTAQPVAVPAEGPLVLTTTGDVPSLTTDTAGEMTLTAGRLNLDLVPGTADGTPADPPSLSLVCLPGEDAGDRTRLAAVPVGAEVPTGEPGTPPSSPAVPPPSAPVTGLPRPSLPADRTAPAAPRTPDGTASGTPQGPQAGKQADEDPPEGEDPPGTAEPRPDAPPCITEKPTPSSLSAYIVGYSNVRKLNGANLIPLSCIQVEQGLIEFVERPDAFHIITPAEGGLSYQGRRQTPPFEATFLTFGFVPTKATVVLEQVGPLTMRGDMALTFPVNTALAHVRVPLILRVLDAEVNGTPLDVGPSCRTVTPLKSPEPEPEKYPGDHLVLVGRGEYEYGKDSKGYLVLDGGPLTGEAFIPAFTGCGARGENLDRLLTAAISGPGNHIKQIQSPVCSVGVPEAPPELCTEDRQPRQIPKPER
ncbi:MULTISPECIES: DUF6801 domain-containing protein [unclassified Streptomyces]|uniref:DUF6801 domain-containing protein n=1 Tax=unclassified Streptomyces TaxID=2593676 RepID=UPI0037020886